MLEVFKDKTEAEKRVIDIIKNTNPKVNIGVNCESLWYELQNKYTTRNFIYCKNTECVTISELRESFIKNDSGICILTNYNLEDILARLEASFVACHSLYIVLVSDKLKVKYLQSLNAKLQRYWRFS